MRMIVSIFLCFLAATLARAEDSTQVQMVAATADAVASLRRQVLDNPILPNFTARQLIDRAGGAATLDAAIRGAQQIGGTRWINDQTCQVRLELSGTDVAKALAAIASKGEKTLPVPLGEFKRHLTTWNNRVFLATGTSTAAAGAERLRPPDGGPWAGVGDDECRRAIAEARNNAADRILASMAPVELENRRRLGDALAIPAVADSMKQWLIARPITSVEFRDDLGVHLTLCAPPATVWAVLRASLQKQDSITLPGNDTAWNILRQQTEARVAVPAGVAYAIAGASTTRAIVFPAKPPEWANQALEADGVARSVGAKLRTARAAESVALQRLRNRIEALPFSADLTVGDAARRDPRINEALGRGMSFARTYQVDYDQPESGSVSIKVQLPLVHVWREMSER